MVRGEGFSTSLVDHTHLFERLRRAVPFDLFVVGAASPEEIQAIQEIDRLDPLILIVPLEQGLAVNPYRLVHPTAALIDRELRDVNGIRNALEPQPAPATQGGATSLSQESIRLAFEPFGLSARQLEVLEHALRGDTSSQIATRLFISELTVRNHLHAIYERVGVSGRRELLGRFVQGLMEGHA